MWLSFLSQNGSLVGSRMAFQQNMSSYRLIRAKEENYIIARYITDSVDGYALESRGDRYAFSFLIKHYLPCL